MTAELTARFNPFAAEFRRDPYPMYRVLRETRPVHKTMGLWVLTRHADVRAVLRGGAFSAALIPALVSRQAARRAAAPADAARLRQIARLGEKSLVFTDNPEHARLRGLVNRVFTAEAVGRLRPRVERVARELTGRLRRRGELDAIADLAAPLPLTVLSGWMALPPALRDRAAEWTSDIRFLLEPGLLSGEDLHRTGRAVEAFTAGLADLVAQRRARPGPDLVSQLAAATTGGTDGDRLDDEEAAFICVMCFVAGHETTKSLIGNALLALLRHPEQGERLRRDPRLAGPAVTEALRYDSPLQMTKRVAIRDTEIGGHLVSAGEQVLLCLGAANRDPEAFGRPDEFDISRGAPASAPTHLGSSSSALTHSATTHLGSSSSAPTHLALGHGMHGCLGGALAQLQATAAVECLYRLPGRLEPAVPPSALEWQDRSLIVRGLKRLPVTLRGDS